MGIRTTTESNHFPETQSVGKYHSEAVWKTGVYATNASIIVTSSNPGTDPPAPTWLTSELPTIRPEASRLSGKSCVAYNCSQHGTYLRLIENLRENLSVERLAKRMGMSSRNFTRVCLRETRMNPGQFVDRMRVEAAQQ